MLHILFIPILMNSTLCNEDQIVKYSNAYQYILNNVELNSISVVDSSKMEPEPKIYISDSIVFIMPTQFFENIIDIKNQKILSVEQVEKDKRELYIAFKEKKSIFEGYNCNSLTKLNKGLNLDKCHYILFFSEIYDGSIIFAELLPYLNRELDNSINEIRRFNKCILLMFYFNDNNQLISTYTVQGQYD